MAITYIDASKLGQGNTGDPHSGNRYISYTAPTGMITTDVTSFQFPSGSQTLLTFGVPLCMFIDNQDDTIELRVNVDTTGQSFPVPANSAGFYQLDAVVGSNISVVGTGSSLAPIIFTFYNFNRQPVVWYKTNITSSAVTIADGADIAQGATTDAAVTNPALNASEIALLKGILTEVSGGGATGPNVNIAKVAGAVVATGHGTAAGSLRVELPTDGTGKVGLNAGAAIVGQVGIDQTVPGTTNGVQVNSALPAGGNVIGHVIVDSGAVNIGPYPSGATFVTNDSGNVANAAAVATLAGVGGKITYLTGFALTASGATLGNDVTATISDGTWTKSYTFTFPVGALVPATPIIIQFNNPLKASAVNTAIVVTLPAGGAGNTNATATVEGYQL